MSPILVRPVREQLEHDRVIRLLQAKYKRKYEVAINPGNEQTMPVGTGPSPWYPDLVLQSSDRGHKLAGVVEVETTESVNNLEAMSQWATFARLRVPFHLYLPTACVDSARRFCADLGIPVEEMWAYQSVGDQLRFTLVQRSGQSEGGRPRSENLPAEPRSRVAAASRPTVAEAPKAPPASKNAPPRPRSNGPTTSRPARRTAGPSVANRRPVGKPKPVAQRRAVSKAAPVRRKAKTAAGSTRAQKRR